MELRFNTLTRDAAGTLVHKWRVLRNQPESAMTYTTVCEIQLLFGLIHSEVVDPVVDIFESVIMMQHCVVPENRATWERAFEDVVRSYEQYFEEHRMTVHN